jgi:hypothetical protein
MFREPVRWLSTASLLYASYLVFSCPCDVLASCQQQQFYAAAATPLIVIALMNANNIV